MARRRGMRLLALVASVAVTLGVLLGAASPARADGEAEQNAEEALAAKWAPVLMLVTQKTACGPGEPFTPSDVDVIFDNPTIALRGPWKPTKDLVEIAPSVETLSQGLPGYAMDLPGNPLDPGCDYEQWADDQGFGAEPTIYAHVATEKGVENRIALQYYFFYAFNDYNNKHETDWERIQLEFSAPTASTAWALGMKPSLVVYSQHYGAEKAQWGDSKLEVEDDTHPVVYVSAGSHANQFSPGVFMGNSAKTGFGCDTTVGDHTAIHPTVKTIPSDKEAALAQFPWTAYEGHWGEVGPKRFYEGPTGPNRKAGWSKPFSGFSANARALSIQMPGAELGGSGTAQVYCDVVGQGSDAFRAFVASPLSTLAILAAVVLAVGWLLRRTAWDADPLPLLERRRAGQVVTASIKMIGRHPVTFIVGSLPMIGVLAASAVLQTVAVTNPVPAWLPVTVTALAVVVTLVTAAALTLAVERIGSGEPHGLRFVVVESTKRLLRGIPAPVGAALVMTLLLSTVVLAPLALVLFIAWYLVLPVVVLERRALFGALLRSPTLVWRTLGTVIPLRLFSALLLTTLGAVLAALLFAVMPISFVALNAVPPVVVGLLQPLNSVMATYAYYAARASEEEQATPQEPAEPVGAGA